MEIFYILISVFFVSCLSLLGGLLFLFQIKKYSTFIYYSLAVSIGVILGAVFFDVLPHVVEEHGSVTLPYVLIGFIGAFIIEKLLNWHHHVDGDHSEHITSAVGYLTLIGDGVHNFLDGIIIATSYLVSPVTGFSTTLAVVAHEIPHELADFAVLLSSGFGIKKALWFNFLSALTAIAGALFVLMLSAYVENIELFMLPIAAGNFMYIAACDLIPQLHKRNSLRQSGVQILLIFIGVWVIYSATLLEH